jgi:hypothetical protein
VKEIHRERVGCSLVESKGAVYWIRGLTWLEGPNMAFSANLCELREQDWKEK